MSEQERGQSIAELLASLSPRVREKFMARLTDEEIRAVTYDWNFWARPQQLPPTDDEWVGWLIMTGRGWGKNRTAGEFAIREIKDGKSRRSAFIARTGADVRDVMIEGESGIMEITPPDFRPTWEPSRRRLTWPNGAMTTTFSAEEPDLLRGPQHDLCWGDEIACLVAGVMVATPNGDVPIERVKRGDAVYTRDGIRKVVAAWRSSNAAEVVTIRSRSVSLTGTLDHPVWVVGRGWVTLDKVVPGDIVFSWFQGLSARSGMVRCTGMFTSIILALSRQISSFITRTATISTMTRQILSRCRDQITRALLNQAVGQRGAMSGGANTFEFGGRIVKLMRSYARRAARHMRREACDRSSVAGRVGSRMYWRSVANGVGSILRSRYDSLSESAVCVIESCLLVISKIRDAVSKLAGTSGLRIVSVDARPSAVLQAVYNLTVEDSGEFFANGFLVHNTWKHQSSWDNAMLGLRLGSHPRWVATTTPKSRPLINKLLAQAEETDAVVRLTTGSTYDNISNLAPVFISQVIRPMEGTRLAIQELYGRTIKDDPNALWRRDTLETYRVTATPELVKIVVGVDPSAKSDETGAETGIIVAGVGRDGHGYLLDDKSLRGTPDQWAKAAVLAFNDWKANSMVAEANNGGDMVISTIQTQSRTLPVKKIFASRGKHTRAEPIAALYEKGMIHHVGFFAELEDQMATWVPGEKSPDRLDAMVWVFTELLAQIDMPVYGRNYAIFSAQRPA